MWNVDPDIKLIGVGSVGDWSEMMLKECSDYMNLISEHIYCKEKPVVTEHIKQLSQEIVRKAEAHRKYQMEIEGLKDNPIPIAMDEWNYWYGDYIYGELGVRYHLKDALGVATGLHEYFRNSDLYFMAN
jgi:alpha-N-arabinofuranosidase